jgi:hypothetical protein
LRFLIKSAEDILKHQPTLTELQNQASVTKTEIKAIRTELAANAQQQKQDHASLEEERDGRLNEKWVNFFVYLFLSVMFNVSCFKYILHPNSMI